MKPFGPRGQNEDRDSKIMPSFQVKTMSSSMVHSFGSGSYLDLKLKPFGHHQSAEFSQV